MNLPFGDMFHFMGYDLIVCSFVFLGVWTRLRLLIAGFYVNVGDAEEIRGVR